MIWNALQTTAKSRRQLVFAMDQAQLPMVKLPIIKQLSQRGLCMGLSITWIAEQYKERNFPVGGDGVCESPPFRAVIYQNLQRHEGEPEWWDFWETAGRPEQLRISTELRGWRETKPTADFIYSIVTKAYGCYGIHMQGVGFIPVGIGGVIPLHFAHEVAIRHGRDNRMHVFDANFGHFVVADHTKLKAFLSWFLAQSGYADRFGTLTGVIGIKPPIAAGS